MTNLRALSTSELMDLGFTLYRRHFVGFFLLALLSQSAVLIGEALIMGFRLDPTMEEVKSHSVLALERGGLVFLIYFCCSLVSFAGDMVITSYLADAYLDKIPSIKESLLGLVRCWGRALWTCLLARLFMLLSFLFPIAALIGSVLFLNYDHPQSFSGFLLSYGLVFLILVLSLFPILLVFMRLLLIVPPITQEGKSGWAAVRRSFGLVMYDPGLGFFYWGEMRLSFLLLPLFAIQLLILSLTSLPFVIYHVMEAAQHGDIASFNQEPDATFIISQLLTFLAGALILPLYTILITLFYYDIRIRREGFDLEVLAERLKT